MHEEEEVAVGGARHEDDLATTNLPQLKKSKKKAKCASNSAKLK
jgi:hypothetical protein